MTTTIPTRGGTAPTPCTRPLAVPPAAGGRPRVHRDHGTPDRYRNGPDENDQPGKGCRCTPCRDAQATDLRNYRQRKARESWGATESTMVDAEPARAHVRALMAEGVGRERIANVSGVGGGSVAALLYGRPADGQRPSARIHRKTADKLLAVTSEAVADGARINATGTKRRLQALIAVGWSGSELMRRLGKTETNFWYILEQPVVLSRTARAVQALYDDLWNQAPPDETPAHRAAAARSRNRARAAGWAPPMAWDDEQIDDPKARPRGVAA